VALLDCKFYSESLKISTSMVVILPQDTETQIGLKNSAAPGRHRTLYLLHGLSDDETIWTRRTSIERYVAPLGLAVVMPAVNRSFYTDMKNGGAYETFVADELPRIARSFFPLSDRREDTFVAGLSMGGYGAFKLALNYPERYAAAASLSGALDIVHHTSAAGLQDRPDVAPDFTSIFGESRSPKGTRHDLFSVLTEKKGVKLPRLFSCCGEEDSLFSHNIAFRDHAASLGVDLTWRSDPGYAHSWDYWDLRIQSVLEWMFAKEA
jgi:S-formylglutathione hydrolase FrmB